MIVFVFRGLRRVLGLLLLSCLLSVTCHPYRIPNPTGPPQPRVRKASRAAKPADESADGRSAAGATEAKPMRNSYDRHEMLKKPKYKRRRLKHKVGQRKFLGITLPF
ncbi:hypothetical protein GCM10022408_06530 [Hymenobacter fastidiosus]|uniref:Quinol oxidase subunit 4 n=1 Tax=Hymenobacter fastidiosus TaxID=486264 RepID=A0ABP7RJE7_9BACT